MTRLVWCLGLPALLLAALYAWGHDPEHVDKYQQWYLEQYQEPIAPNVAPTKCCGDIDKRGGDAHYADVIAAGGGYWVKVGVQWLAYDKPVNPYHRNPVGRNIVWYSIDEEGRPYFLCLRLAEGT